MTGSPSLGQTETTTLPSLEEYREFKKRISEHPDGDTREAFRVISKLEVRVMFLQQEFDTVMGDYLLEVERSNHLHAHLIRTIQLLKIARGEQ
jgi:hypothetical protein